MTRPVVLKFGGELLENGANGANGACGDRGDGREDTSAGGQLAHAVAAVAAILASRPAPDIVHGGLVIVHGGGRAIDAALKGAGLEKRQVDGLRITDAATLDVVVSVLRAVNLRFVSALNAAGVPAVGLTGADAHCGLATAAPPHRAVDGRLVDLGHVGVPEPDVQGHLLTTLIRDNFVPVLACIGAGRDGRLFNVNADTLAGHLAASLRARRLIVAGTTAGVLDADGRTLAVLDTSGIARIVNDRTATAGMIAKLRACEQALSAGVDDVVIVDGRDRAALIDSMCDSWKQPREAPRSATRLIRMVPA